MNNYSADTDRKYWNKANTEHTCRGIFLWGANVINLMLAHVSPKFFCTSNVVLFVQGPNVTPRPYLPVSIVYNVIYKYMLHNEVKVIYTTKDHRPEVV